jgi:lysophospholipase L1-like esterase
MIGVTTAAHAAGVPNIVFDGDSISAGAGAPPGHGPDVQLAEALGGHVIIHDVAVGGRPVFQCVGLYDRTVAPRYQRADPDNVIVFHAGDNDIAAGRTAQQTYAAFTEYTARAHRQGWKVVVSTEMRHPFFTPPQEQQLELYNQMLRHNDAGADAVVDLNADPRFSDLKHRTDVALFAPDRLHPSERGYGILVAMLTPAVRAVLNHP